MLRKLDEGKWPQTTQQLLYHDNFFFEPAAASEDGDQIAQLLKDDGK